MKNLIVILMILNVSLFAFADDDIVQITTEGTSTSDIPAKARSESLRDAIDKGCLEVITRLIGQVKVEKNMAIVHNKVMAQTSKFVQFYKASEPLQKGSQFETSVTMKISISSLKDILGQEGLLYQSEGPATILPVIKVVEKKDNGHQFRWWLEEVSPENAFLRDETKAILHQFDGVFRPKGFYLIDPISQHYVQWIPEPFRNEAPGLDDLLWMGDFFKAQMVLAGEASLAPTSSPGGVKLSVKVTAYHSANGRVVGEVIRNFENVSNDWDLSVQQVIKKGFAEVAKDISSQIFEEWSRGTFGATLLRISLRGNMGYQDLENFKKQILHKIGDVKTIRERHLEVGNAVFEVDAAGGVDNLSKRLETTSFEGFRVSVNSREATGVELHWSKGQ